MGGDLRLKDIVVIVALAAPLWAILRLAGVNQAGAVFTSGIVAALGLAAYYIRRDYVRAGRSGRSLFGRYAEHPYVAVALVVAFVGLGLVCGLLLGSPERGAVVGALAWPVGYEGYLYWNRHSRDSGGGSRS